MFQLLSLLTLFFCIFYIALVIWFIKGWKSVKYSLTSEIKPSIRISVIIPARNEENTIELVINDVLTQNYPSELVELIVVDDHSTDKTAEKLRNHISERTTIITLNESQKLNSYKKMAISRGIAKATGELIVTTDADCRMGPNWLAAIADCKVKTGCELISGPVGFFNSPRFFDKVQQVEFMTLIGIGAASVANQFPGTCNGANLAYSRDLFYRMNGFAGIEDIASGDDELFLHKVFEFSPTCIQFLKNKDAIVYTAAKHNLFDFVQQRKRWASKSIHYRNKWLVALVCTVFSFNVFLLINLFLAIYSGNYFLFAIQFFCKIVLDYSFIHLISTFFKQEKLRWYLIPTEVFYVFYIVMIGIYGNLGGYTWKDRKVK